jgi:restriction system protein
MKQYRRIMAGRKSIYAKRCREGGFIGSDYGFPDDLSNFLPDSWREFNERRIPEYLARRPEKSKIAAGLACGMLHGLCKGMPVGTIVLTPDGFGAYMVGVFLSEYYLAKDEILPHRRKINWYEKTIQRSEMSQAMQYSTGATGTVIDITKYAEEIELLIAGNKPPQIVVNEEDVEDPSVFALEKHLEEFLVQNWHYTALGQDYDIYEEEGEIVGQQFPSDTGPIDILAIKKDKSELLVVELKKGRASDRVVGQIQRYMGYVIEELAEESQTVRGIIIALEDDLKVKRALRVAPNIDFYRYKIDFKLIKG